MITTTRLSPDNTPTRKARDVARAAGTSSYDGAQKVPNDEAIHLGGGRPRSPAKYDVKEHRMFHKRSRSPAKGPTLECKNNIKGRYGSTQIHLMALLPWPHSFTFPRRRSRSGVPRAWWQLELLRACRSRSAEISAPRRTWIPHEPASKRNRESLIGMDRGP